jgi:hypothetical protein
MGLIRKTLRATTLGAVASRSHKQRTQAQILAAVQGKTAAEIEIAGGRGSESYNRTLHARRETYGRGFVPKKKREKPVFTDEERAYMAAHAVRPGR